MCHVDAPLNLWLGLHLIWHQASHAMTYKTYYYNYIAEEQIGEGWGLMHRSLKRRGQEVRMHFNLFKKNNMFLLKQGQLYTDVYYFCTMVLFREWDSVGQRKKREQLILVQLNKHLIQQAVDLTNQISMIYHIKPVPYSQTLRHQVCSNHNVTETVLMLTFERSVLPCLWLQYRQSLFTFLHYRNMFYCVFAEDQQ